MSLIIENLHVSAGETPILRGLDLTVKPGEVHAIMGPNGSGKSTLAHVLMGHPGYSITKGKIALDGKTINRLAPERRAKLGLFLGFQYPIEIPGVSITAFLRAAYNSLKKEKLTPIKLRRLVEEKARPLHIKADFIERPLNENFSGGEKKRNEILQMAVLEPAYAILDETDSGLDIDSLRTVANGINRLRSPKRAIVLITHYQRLLNFIKPDFVHIMLVGQIVRSGTFALAKNLEKTGYAGLALKK